MSVFLGDRRQLVHYGVFTLDGAELKEVKSLRIFEVTLGSKLMFETYLSDAVLEASRNMGIVRQAGKLFYCLRVLKSCFIAYALSNLEWMCGCRLQSLIWNY